MSRRGRARRALDRIRQDPDLNASFIDQTRGMNQTQIDEEARRFIQIHFESLPQLADVELEARVRRARQRRQRAQEVMLPMPADDPPPIFAAPPRAPMAAPMSPPPFAVAPVAVPPRTSDVNEFRQWVENHRDDVLNQGMQYLIRSGDTYYVLSYANYRELLMMISDYDYGFDVFDEGGSDARLIIEIANTQDFTVSVFEPDQVPSGRNMNPDRNRGSFLPYTHVIDDPFIKTELAKYGLWSEVNADNYTTSCLVQSLMGTVSEEIVEDIKRAVRNATVPRKHLRYIGSKYHLKFVIHTDGDKAVRTYGDGDLIELCLYKGHYFPCVKDTGITGFALRNWQALKAKYPDNWYTKGGMRGQRGVGVSSMRLLKLMLDPRHGLVRSIDIANPEIWKTVYLNRVNKSFDRLEYTDEAIRLVHPPRGVIENKRDFNREVSRIKRNRQKLLEMEGGADVVARLEKQIEERKLGYEEQNNLYRANMLPTTTIFFDFESCPQGFHEPYFVAWQVDGESEVNHASGATCALKFLEWIEFFYGYNGGNEEQDQPEIMLIAHNVSYDLSFLLEFLEGGTMNAIKKGSRFISASGMFKSVELHFKDSYKIIPSALRHFSQMFNLPYEKELMPYDVFTHEFIHGDFLIDPDVIAEAYDQKMVDEMRPNMEKHECVTDDGRWDMLKYSKFYCERDVELLNAGWNAFRRMTLEFFDLDINAKEVLTTASMAYKHLQNQCFEGTYSVSGLVLEFIRQATFGGQTQSARNEALIVEGQPILDMDKVSLYPTAMVHMPGIPLGKPKPFYAQVPDDADYFFVQIDIHCVKGPDYDFPILPMRTAEGTNDWTNDIEGKRVIVGRQTLEDLIDWNDIFDYTVLRGYYWNEGWNTHLSGTIQHMYDKRAELKREGNPAQLIFKLLMNSSYGRTGLKPISDMDYYIAPDKLNRFIANNFYRISQMNIMPNGDTRVMANKAIDRHYNQQHVAAMILETSKHLMRKVLLLQQRIESPLAQQIFYTDTDSIHVSEMAWRELELIYKTKYGEQLEGKALGQFHSDFELEGTFMIRDHQLVPTDLDTSVLKGGSLYSRKLIVCGKKAYLDILTSTENLELEVYHFRLKGIPETSIVCKCNSSYEGQIERMYEDLSTGMRMSFTLSGLFKTGLDGLIQTTSMDRTVQFKPARMIEL